MPLQKITHYPGYTIGLWQLNEAVDDLFEQVVLTPADRELYQTLAHDRRKREFLATRKLLSALAGPEASIGYNKLRQPVLNGSNRYISISHSASMAAVLISEKPMGIDAEELSRDVEKIAQRFLSAVEQEWTLQAANTGISRIICWSAKEAIFKLMAQPEVTFSRQILLEPFTTVKNGSIQASFVREDEIIPISLLYELNLDNCVVWCIRK